MATGDFARMVSAEQRLRQQIRDRLVHVGTLSWTNLGSWRDSDVERFIDQIVPVVQAGRLQVAQLTDVYLGRLTGAGPTGTIDTSHIRGVDIEDVYQRPAVTMRTELSNGASFAAALDTSVARLASLISTDLQLSMRNQAHASLNKSRNIEAYARTLTGAENCALCLIASTQRYLVKDLQPIHPGCDCGVAPLGKGEHYEQVINPELLEATHAAVGDFAGVNARDGRSLRGHMIVDTGGESRIATYKDLVVTHEHGEYGPTLAWRGQHFTSADDISSSSHPAGRA